MNTAEYSKVAIRYLNRHGIPYILPNGPLPESAPSSKGMTYTIHPAVGEILIDKEAAITHIASGDESWAEALLIETATHHHHHHHHIRIADMIDAISSARGGSDLFDDVREYTTNASGFRMMTILATSLIRRPPGTIIE